MPTLQTTHFGDLTYNDDSAYRFRSGLPGFESEHVFVFLNQPQTEPLIFMQSASSPGLCFILLPIRVVDPQYNLTLEPEDLSELRLPKGRQPRIGDDILCCAVIRSGENTTAGPTANMLAPIVVNLKHHIGMQVIQAGSGYSHQQGLFTQDALVSC